MAKATSKGKGTPTRPRPARTTSRVTTPRAGATAAPAPKLEEPREDELELAAADEAPDEGLDGTAHDGTALDDDDESLRLDPTMLPVAAGGGGVVAVAPPANRRVAPPDALLRVPGAQFIYESYLELTKVTWPTFETARNMTLLVLAFSAAVAIVITVMDIGLSHVLAWLLGLGSK